MTEGKQGIFPGHPLCEECLKYGRYMKATVIDHIVPHCGDQKLFWDQSSWQTLCKKCHDQKIKNKGSVQKAVDALNQHD